MSNLPQICNIEDCNNPYILEYIIKNKDEKVPALTKKNSDFIDAVVKLDSNYSKETEATPPIANSNFEKNPSKPDKYSGSAKYWFGKMKAKEEPFERCVLGAVIAIDASNSTHLEAAVNARKEMTARICKKCNNTIEGLIKELKKPICDNRETHLLVELTEPIPAKNEKRKGDRYNLSFASKFCACAAKELVPEIEYSKYDNVVSDALPRYTDLYGIKKGEAKNTYKIKANEKKKCKNADEHLKLRIAVYEKYCKSIDAIIEKVKINGGYQDLNKEKLDHIIWYAFKGK